MNMFAFGRRLTGRTNPPLTGAWAIWAPGDSTNIRLYQHEWRLC
ncbi:MAG: hypothetical protein V1681_05850 [Candidatus Neomarinimicrobiota bacterium]